MERICTSEKCGNILTRQKKYCSRGCESAERSTHRTIKLDQEKVVLLYRESQSVVEVAKFFDVSKTVINRILSEADEPKREVTKSGTLISKTCIGCGEVFTKRPGMAKVQSYCTRECAMLYREHPRTSKAEKALTALSWNLKQLGWTLERFQAINYAQGGLCYICGQSDYSEGRGRRLSADHDHNTMIARGLLCGPCNVVLIPMVEKGLLSVLTVEQYLSMFEEKQ